MDSTCIIEQSECKNVINEIIKCIEANKYYKAITKLEILKENFTVEEVEGVLSNIYFSELGDIITGLMCGKACGECIDGSCNSDCCEGAGTCICGLVICYVAAKCIPGCGSGQECCVECACSPCRCCTQQILPRACECCFDDCCAGFC